MKESEESHACEKSYELPDGRKIVIGSERFRASEIYFQPTLAGYDLEGIDKYCFDSVNKCENEIRRELFLNVILSGGSTLFEGFGERLWWNMFNLAPSALKVKIYAPPERKYSSWLGASILSSLSTF